MEKPNFDDFFESYLDIDSWAEKQMEKEYEIQNRRKKSFSKKSKEQQMGSNNDNRKRFSRKTNGKNIARKRR
jgi:hypothetical protein